MTDFTILGSTPKERSNNLFKVLDDQLQMKSGNYKPEFWAREIGHFSYSSHKRNKDRLATTKALKKELDGLHGRMQFRLSPQIASKMGLSADDWFDLDISEFLKHHLGKLPELVINAIYAIYKLKHPEKKALIQEDMAYALGIDIHAYQRHIELKVRKDGKDRKTEEIPELSTFDLIAAANGIVYRVVFDD